MKGRVKAESKAFIRNLNCIILISKTLKTNYARLCAYICFLNSRVSKIVSRSALSQ